MAQMTVMDAMQLQMDYANQRQVVLSRNIANSDTPGYKAEDLEPLNFKDHLGRHLQLTTTSSHHLKGKKGNSHFQTVKDKHTFETSPTGNNVALDEQTLKLSTNSNEYQVTTNLYRQFGTMLKTAIDNGH